MPELTPEQQIDNLQQQLDLTRKRFAAIKAALKQAEGAKMDAEKALSEKRGGVLRQPAQRLLATLAAIENEVL
jgi:hypothetical protein